MQPVHPKRGRPRLKASERKVRDKIRTLRCDDKRWERIKAAARKENKSTAAYLLDLADPTVI